jgi:Sugar transferases involved in lipopolysaccharide synthesis
MYGKRIKRILDIVLSGLALIFLSPIMLITAILVKIKLGKPIIFMQERPGKGEKSFKLIKFRTMNVEKNKDGNLLTDEERLTGFGRFLRATSLDELPEFVNILKGDMSIVGPRPLLMKYLPFYKDEERVRHSVRPGLTGLAQINGRNNVDWDERLKYDIKYVENITFIRDVKIIIRTIGKVLGRRDIASGKQLIIQDLDKEREWMLERSKH